MQMENWNKLQLRDGRLKKKNGPAVKGHLPPELVGEILLHLPCKLLHRFKCISKLFALFLCDFQFISEHRKRNMKPSHYLIWDASDRTKLHVFSLCRDEYRHVKTISTQESEVASPSSYGLVCIYRLKSKSVALLNPVSGKMVSLPGPISPTTWPDSRIGFGFDPKSQTYKVVQLALCRVAVNIQCFVLSVNKGPTFTCSWRDLGDVSIKEMNTAYFLWQPIYVDGVLYWEMGVTAYGIFIPVVVFDLSTEKMNVIRLPVKYSDCAYGDAKHLTSLEDNLCCVEITVSTDRSSLLMEIWKLNHDFDGNDDVSWIPAYKLDICGYSRMLYPICMDDQKRIIFQGSQDLYRYDIQSKSLELYPVTGEVEGAGRFPYINLPAIHSETVTPIPQSLY